MTVQTGQRQRTQSAWSRISASSSSLLSAPTGEPSPAKSAPVVPGKNDGQVPHLSCDQPIYPRKLRKVYLKHKSSKGGSISIREETVVSATYRQSESDESIQIITQGDTGLIKGILCLESPRPKNNKGLSDKKAGASPVTTTGNPILRPFRRMMPAVPQSGHFLVRSKSDSAVSFPSKPKKLVYSIPLPFDKLVLLASKISSRRSRRFLNQPGVHPRFWFVQAMWEGMRRLDQLQKALVAEVTEHAPIPVAIPGTVPALVDSVMENFEHSWLKFHHKIMRLQQKSDKDMSILRARNLNMWREAESRNQGVSEKLRSSQEMLTVNARLGEKEENLQQRLNRLGGSSIDLKKLG